MFIVLSNQANVNQNNFEISSYPHQNGKDQWINKCNSTFSDMSAYPELATESRKVKKMQEGTQEKMENNFTVGGVSNCCSQY